MSGSLLCDTIFSCNLLQLVDQPTHVKGNILDLVLTNDFDLVKSLNVHEEGVCPLCSDHYMITVCLTNCAKSKCELFCGAPIMVFDFPKADWEGLSNFLLDQDFSWCDMEDDVEIIWSGIKTSILLGMDRFIPKVRLKRHQFPKWFTPALRHKYKCLKTLERRCEWSPTKANLNKRSRLVLEFTGLAEQAKGSFEDT